MFGHIIHLIQDSFPQGHTIRDSANTEGGTTSAAADAFEGVKNRFEMAPPENCGNVYYFQGYPAQEGNKQHSKYDLNPATDRDKQLWECAKYYTARSLELFDLCNHYAGAVRPDGVLEEDVKKATDDLEEFMAAQSESSAELDAKQKEFEEKVSVAKAALATAQGFATNVCDYHKGIGRLLAKYVLPVASSALGHKAAGTDAALANPDTKALAPFYEEGSIDVGGTAVKMWLPISSAVPFIGNGDVQTLCADGHVTSFGEHGPVGALGTQAASLATGNPIVIAVQATVNGNSGSAESYVVRKAFVNPSQDQIRSFQIPS
jgi:hypothetical protein